MVGKEIEQIHPLKKFTLKQIDQFLYTSSQVWDLTYPRHVVELWDEAYDYLRANGIKSSDTGFPNILVIERSRKLKSFLKRNRPETVFFDPEEIAERLNSKSNILVDHKKTKKYEQWIFHLNRQRFPLKEDEIECGITYKKPLVDVDAGKFEPYHPEPYVVVEFAAAYENGNIIFKPELQQTYGDFWDEGGLQKQMLILLGLSEKRVEQKLSFRLQKKQEGLPNGETRTKYMVTACIAT